MCTLDDNDSYVIVLMGGLMTELKVGKLWADKAGRAITVTDEHGIGIKVRLVNRRVRVPPIRSKMTIDRGRGGPAILLDRGIS